MSTLLESTASSDQAAGHRVLGRVRAHLPEIAARSAEAEAARAVSADLIAALREAGVFRMSLPRAWGGEQLDLVESARVVREISRADGSAGWTVQAASMAWFFVRSLPHETLANEVFGDGADLMLRGAIAPKGRAVRVAGGYRLSGRWPLASGSFTPDWMLAGFVVEGAPALPDGRPDMRVALVRPEQATFLDTWDAVGLRATQSTDFTMDDVFVPDRFTGPLVGGNNIPAPFYGLPYTATGSSHDAVIIGCLEGALDDLAELAATKRPAFDPRVVIGEDPVFQEKFAELHLRTAALNALLEQTGRVVMDRALAGEEPTAREWFGYTGGHQHIHHEGIRLLNELMTLSGSSGLYSSHPLQRRWRDVRCVSQHVAGNNGSLRRLGAVLSGREDVR
ncbi:acyl-CoA dehydrogenase family protein [Streptomyces collinus]|uniref:Alkylation response protein AidB-like acyl-CoA dehydrogenase n=1 Tax=Streptomyces collinus TaxID=42684 RepID=A0AA89QII9_STRCU|nr:acyl-CoA dehydrogenase family protein [Streptomyces collinus]MBB5816110.1 alkylation response protein AidB-like acyl-CoA dehydrogenase [Streptomyces collinus]WMX68964.1 acyl-CoA dehydrogenase family protein [Streptomyces collinus]